MAVWAGSSACEEIFDLNAVNRLNPGRTWTRGIWSRSWGPYGFRRRKRTTSPLPASTVAAGAVAFFFWGHVWGSLGIAAPGVLGRSAADPKRVPQTPDHSVDSGGLSAVPGPPLPVVPGRNRSRRRPGGMNDHFVLLDPWQTAGTAGIQVAGG